MDASTSVVPNKARKRKNRRKRNKKKAAGPNGKNADSGSEGQSEDESGSEDEGQRDYVKGGYHPVQLGELYNKRYRVLSKLGWGQFSTVWLCKDEALDAPRRILALKIQRSASKYTEAAVDEITLCSQVRDGDPTGAAQCVQLVDSFEHRGPHGCHVCMAFPVYGQNLLALIKAYDYKGIPLPVVKSIARQVLLSLNYIHTKLNIIHTDLKPENIVLMRDDFVMIEDMAQRRWEVLQTPPDGADANQGTAQPGAALKLTKNQKKRAKAKAKAAASAASAEQGAGTEAVPTPAEDKEAPQDSEPGAQPSNMTGAAGQWYPNRKDLPEIPKQRLMSIDSAVGCVLADFGSACWTHKKFTDDIQTRQYRCPEVMVGSDYGCSADMWSFACLIFELSTGDLLFDPHEGRSYSRDEDHLAQAIELIGPIPKKVALGGKWSRETFDKKGSLKHISKLKFWPLSEVLQEKYEVCKEDAIPLAAFLMRLLVFDPEERATAADMLGDPWLQEAAESAAKGGSASPEAGVAAVALGVVEAGEDDELPGLTEAMEGLETQDEVAEEEV